MYLMLNETYPSLKVPQQQRGLQCSRKAFNRCTGYVVYTNYTRGPVVVMYPSVVST